MAGPQGPSQGKCGTTDSRSYKALGRELDEVGRVSSMADLMGPSAPDAYEAMNL